MGVHSEKSKDPRDPTGRLTAEFYRLDKNGDGILSSDELFDGLRGKYNQDVISEMFEELDNRDNKISLEDYLDYWQAKFTTNRPRHSTDEAARKRAADPAAEAVEEAPEAMARRPHRSGMWFIVHRSLLVEVKHSGTCDVHDEFLRWHPNGIPLASEFTAVQLDDNQVATQHELIRMSSYRWENVKGI